MMKYVRIRLSAGAISLAMLAAGCGSNPADVASAGSADTSAPATTVADGAKAPEASDQPASDEDLVEEVEDAATTEAPDPVDEGEGEQASASDVTTTAAPAVTTPSSTTTTTEAPLTTTAATGQLVNLVGGGQLDLNSIEGTDTVLWFWAPW